MEGTLSRCGSGSPRQPAHEMCAPFYEGEYDYMSSQKPTIAEALRKHSTGDTGTQNRPANYQSVTLLSTISWIAVTYHLLATHKPSVMLMVPLPSLILVAGHTAALLGTQRMARTVS
jgi:hypothetical protein